MNKLFAALLFFCVVGASVLWWLMKTLPDDHVRAPVESVKTHETSQAEKNEKEPSQKTISEEPSIVKLSIDTVPAGAKVEIAGIYQGVTPLSVALPKEASEALIALDGYEVYRRAVPTNDQTEGIDLNWKITLKEKEKEVPPKAEEKIIKKEEKPKKIKPLKHAWLKGSKGPYFVQLKSVEESVGKTSIESDLSQLRESLGFDKIHGCLVSLPNKGKWFRIMAGPFSTRAKAEAKRGEWMSKKSDPVEGFVTGRQNCL